MVAFAGKFQTGLAGRLRLRPTVLASDTLPGMSEEDGSWARCLNKLLVTSIVEQPANAGIF
jgi:hypothetical protein